MQIKGDSAYFIASTRTYQEPPINY